MMMEAGAAGVSIFGAGAAATTGGGVGAVLTVFISIGGVGAGFGFRNRPTAATPRIATAGIKTIARLMVFTPS